MCSYFAKAARHGSYLVIYSAEFVEAGVAEASVLAPVTVLRDLQQNAWNLDVIVQLQPRSTSFGFDPTLASHFTPSAPWQQATSVHL